MPERRLAGAASAACLLGYLALAAAAYRQPYFGWDPVVARAVQALPIGPLYPAVAFYGWLLGIRQVVFALAVVGLVALVSRRGALLMAGGALSAAAYQLTDLLVHRPRPDPALVHVVQVTPSNSFPSGHEVFFTWLAILLVVVLKPRLPAAAVPAAWALAVLVIALTGFCRIWAGAHWPSDVLGGFLLGLGWTLGLLALAGRYFSLTPSSSHSR